MTRPILNYDKARDDALANRVSIREALENQAQQAVAAERAKYAPLVKAVDDAQKADKRILAAITNRELRDAAIDARLAALHHILAFDLSALAAVERNT